MMTDEKKEKQQTDAPKADEQPASQAEQDLLDEMYRTGVVPSGYAFNVEDGLQKQVEKGK